MRRSRASGFARQVVRDRPMTDNPSGHSADCSANNTDAVPDQRINDPRYSGPDAHRGECAHDVAFDVLSDGRATCRCGATGVQVGRATVDGDEIDISIEWDALPLSTAQTVERLRQIPGFADDGPALLSRIERALLSACEYILFLEEWPQLEGLELPKALYSREQFLADVAALLEGSDAGST